PTAERAARTLAAVVSAARTIAWSRLSRLSVFADIIQSSKSGGGAPVPPDSAADSLTRNSASPSQSRQILCLPCTGPQARLSLYFKEFWPAGFTKPRGLRAE